jgi:CheY-like chemotaxis protein
MMEALPLKDDVLERFARDCKEHEDAVRSLVAAQTQGLLDAKLALRQCGMELHSVKGLASVLGLAEATSAIGTLSDVMLRQDPLCETSFFGAFEAWFAQLIHCLRELAAGHRSPALRALPEARNRLLALLHPRPVEPAGQQRANKSWMLTPSAGRRLLLVDDSATICAALSAQLRDRGYPVRAARNLAQTAELLASFKPEIVVTDVHMPDVEGDELCRRIKAHMSRVVPVVLYSILPHAQLAQLALAAGADAFVHKGDGVDALVSRMDELLSDEILF